MAMRNSEPPWTCTVCVHPVYNTTITRCPRPGCTGKKLIQEKASPSANASKSFIKESILQTNEPLAAADGEEHDEDAEMKTEDETMTETKYLQEAIKYNKIRGWCSKQHMERLQEISPKVPTKIELAKAGRDNYGEEMRLLKNQEAQLGSLRTKIAGYDAKSYLIREQQLANVAEEVERHAKAVEALNTDSNKLMELNEKASAEAEAILKQTEERYAVDLTWLNDARTAAPVIATEQATKQQTGMETTQTAASAPMLATVDAMQAHMQATGVTSPEELALVPKMVAMLNAMMAAHLASATSPKSVTVTTPDVDASGTGAQATEVELEEQRLAAEAAMLNGERAVATYAAGKPGRHSDRVNPMA